MDTSEFTDKYITPLSTSADIERMDVVLDVATDILDVKLEMLRAAYSHLLGDAINANKRFGLTQKESK